MSNTHAPLTVSNLNKHYGSFAVLNQLNLEVVEGAVHGLVGLNGSGKTTTLECILGMQAFDSGMIKVLGHKPAQLYEARGGIVSIFDSPSLNPNLSVRQVLEHARILCDKPTRSPEEVEQMLGIRQYSKFRIQHLSLGNRRRASIAQALIGRPAFIILDEPFNGLDAGGVDDVLALISRLNREEGTAFLLSSHQLPYLEQICSHMAILHKGQIAVSDKVDTLFKIRQTSVIIRCDQQQKARQLLSANSDLKIISPPENGAEIRVHPGQLSSADINRLLMENGIAVSELIIERPSLTSLFHEITGTDTATGEVIGAAA
jgi:ABC-2 type transport system ATP-binding protein